VWNLEDEDAGHIAADQAREQILEVAGGNGTPDWARPGLRPNDPRKGSTYLENYRLAAGYDELPEPRDDPAD